MGTAIVALLTLFKLGKVGGTLLTMLVSLAIYAQIFGWQYAAGFIGLLFVHEMGHFIAARQKSLPVSAPTFIPFVGAWIELKDQPMDVETEAYVASAGPFLGTIGALLVYLWARHTDSDLLLAVAYSGFFLNFFNLIPLSPLDGGRMTAILGPRIWFLGVPMMLALMLYRPSPLLFVIAIAALPALRQAWNYDPEAPENQAYYNASAATKIQYGVFYLGLAAFLALMTDGTHQMLQ
ncbi:site-2 protease family protein [Sphingomonas sp. JC676]|uniref:site-2 protease family protein n=1 Tax=Sphingomonas sp. JC676 TaxID=2768065 RepID=UPI0016582892|nr:site-2 protease family protein [Sphingomonas sp. JC676]MBC9032747.1 site-2 protease family protein [Sphingomonas sp. JC676]